MRRFEYFVASFCSLLVLSGASLIHGCSGQSAERGAGQENATPAAQTDTTELETARQSFLHGQLPSALQEVEQGLKKSRNNASLLSLKGDIETYDCQFKKAIEDYSKAISYRPAPSSYAGRGEANLRIGNYSDARKDIQKALGIPGGEDYNVLLQEVDNLEYDCQHAVKDPAKLWAIACTASLYTNRGNGSNTLAGSRPSDDLAAAQKQVLANYWTIQSRDQLLAMLKRLVHDFDNNRWQKMRKIKNTPALLDVYSRGWNLPEDYTHAVELLQQHSDEYGESGLLAWDYCRYMNICRGGYQAKYLSEDEAWTLMMPMAARIQTLAKSWDQLESEYLVGFSFWSQSTFAKNEWRYMRNVHRLLKDPNSPWVKLAWNTKLDDRSDDTSIYAAIDKVAGNRGPGM